MMNREKINRWETIIMIAAISLFAAFTIIMFSDEFRLMMNCKAETTGTVVSSEPLVGEKSNDMIYQSMVQPDDTSAFGGAQTVSVNSKYKYTEGESVKIYYDAADASKYYFEHSKPGDAILTFLIFKGTIFLIGIFAAARFIRRMKNM